MALPQGLGWCETLIRNWYFRYADTSLLLLQGTGDVAQAMSLYREMQQEGLSPNRVICNSLLAVCAAAGDADGALEIYK